MIFSDASPARTIIATTKLAPKKKVHQLLRRNAEILPVKISKGRVDLKALMKILAKRGIINILIEGGAELAASAVDAGVVDKVMVFIAPKIIAKADRVSGAINVKDIKSKKVGTDFLFEGKI